MSRRALLPLTLGAALLGPFSCADEPFIAPTEVAPCEPSEMRRARAIFHGDLSFTENERAAIQDATTDLFAFTSGHVDFLVAWDLDTLRSKEPMILRAESWMQEVKDEEREQGATLGAFTRRGSGPERIVLIVDRSGEHLRYVTTHELGHMADFEWPDCHASRSVCRHSPDPTAVMAPLLSGNPLGPGDFAMCRASCLCP